MPPRLLTLLDGSSGPMAIWSGMPGCPGAERSPTRWTELAAVLEARNGFMAFDGALHVFPAGPTAWNLHLASVNDPEGWRREFWHRCEGMVFFASNAFGDLYGLKGDEVIRFDPETGADAVFAADLAGWADRILDDWRLETGYEAMAAWQDRNGAVDEGLRLMPTQPFAFGGSNALENLRAVPLLEGLAMRGSVATQTRNLPDGAKVRIEVR